MKHHPFVLPGVRLAPLLAFLCTGCLDGAPEAFAVAPDNLRAAALAADDTGSTGSAAPIPDAGLTPPASQQRYGCEPGGALAGKTYLFVNAAAPAGGTGTRAAPYRSLQSAYLTIQNGQNAVLCVAEGTHTEHVGSTADRFTSGTEITLVGGFLAGSSFTQRDSTAHPTLLRAPDRTVATLVFGNLRAITVDGFRITGGLHGIAILSGYSAGRTVVIRNNHVFDNGIEGQRDHRGGGLRLSGSTVLVEHNLVEDNKTGAGGAGIYIGSAASSESNTRSGGTLTVSSALATVAHNIVRNNVARYDTPHGAGISVSMNARIHHNLIEGNRGHGPLSGPGGQGVGGGIIAQFPLITVTVDANWISGNIATKAGGGIFIDEASIGTVINNVVVGNQGVGAICIDGRGSGNAVDDRGYATLANNTVVGNTDGAIYLLDSTVRAYNNVFWSNGARDIISSTSGAIPEDITLDHNVLASGCTGPATCTLGSHNLVGSDPLLLDPAAGDYQLGAGSPALSAGTRPITPAFSCAGALTAAPPADFTDFARPTGTAVDLGAFARKP